MKRLLNLLMMSEHSLKSLSLYPNLRNRYRIDIE
jgi:hypothetical protein